MRFGGLVAVDDRLVHRPGRGEITADHRPPTARGKTTVLQLHHRVLQADRRAAHLAAATRTYLLERMIGHEIGQKGTGGAYLPEHPACFPA